MRNVSLYYILCEFLIESMFVVYPQREKRRSVKEPAVSIVSWHLEQLRGDLVGSIWTWNGKGIAKDYIGNPLSQVDVTVKACS